MSTTSLARAHSAIRGTTVIELIAALTVTAIVAALIASSWQTYRIRSRVEMGLLSAERAQAYIERAVEEFGELPPEASFPILSGAAAEYIDRITVAAGRVDIHFNDARDSPTTGKMLALTPFETADMRIVWICGNRAPGPGLRPLGFITADRQPTHVHTSIERRYLPKECR